MPNIKIKFERFALPDSRTNIEVGIDQILDTTYIDLAAIKGNQTPAMPLHTPNKIHTDILFLKKAGLREIALVRFENNSSVVRGGVDHVLVPIGAYNTIESYLKPRAQTRTQMGVTAKVA